MVYRGGWGSTRKRSGYMSVKKEGRKSAVNNKTILWSSGVSRLGKLQQETKFCTCTMYMYVHCTCVMSIVVITHRHVFKASCTYMYSVHVHVYMYVCESQLGGGHATVG